MDERFNFLTKLSLLAAVTELADAMDLKSIGRKTLSVRVPLAPLFYLSIRKRKNDEIQFSFN
jgi:hypothetical protein